MVSLICSVPVLFRNHFHYIPCSSLYYILKVLLSVPPTSDTQEKTLCSLCFIFLYIFFYLFHSVPNRDIPKLGTSHLSFLILILSPLSSHLLRFGSLHSVSKSKLN